MRRWIGIALLVVAVGGCDGRPAMLLVGDSNVSLNSDALDVGFDSWDLDAEAEYGASILPGQCPTCSRTDWATILDGADGAAAIVVELGVNDTAWAGTDTTQGFADYPAKIRWLLDQLPDGPVYWSNLPCPLLPAPRAEGCAAVNDALAAADRTGELTLVDWASVARPEDYGKDRIHLTFDGAIAWARTVSEATRDR